VKSPSKRPRQGPAISLVRPLIRRLTPYVPGEQPKIPGLIKLNTNENPYPPSPKVLEAVRAAANGRLRLYPNPTAEPLREKLAALHGVKADNIIVGNGSDELLAMASRAFVEPASPKVKGRVAGGISSKSKIQFFTPSYSLYPVLAAIHGASSNPAPLPRDFSLPQVDELRREQIWDFRAALTYVTTPNAPTGRGYLKRELEALCAAQCGVVVLDEAYADFGSESAVELAGKLPQVIVARTFSKGYSLCAQRIGYFVGDPVLIEALHKIRDSYNVNALGQAAALATLEDLPYYHGNFRRIIASRGLLSAELSSLGFDVLPSATNFIFTKPPRFHAKVWLEKLRQRKILVRWFDQKRTRDFLRITIGSEEEVAALIVAAKSVLGKRGDG